MQVCGQPSDALPRRHAEELKSRGELMPLKSIMLSLSIVLGGLTISAAAQNAAVPNPEQLETMSARFAPTPLRVDTSKLRSGDREALVKLIAAARILNSIFMQQFWD